MDIAILILVIVAVILLGILTFFIFQIWVQSKETKIQLTNHLQEIQKGFSNSDSNLKTLNLQLIESIRIENKGLVSSIDQLKEEIKDLEKELKAIESEILKNIDNHIQNSEGKIADGLESVKNKTNSTIEGLTDSVKLFKDNIESRIKELDSNISDKLVDDLTHLTNTYSKGLKEEQSKLLERFEQATKEINKKQGDILKAITEPLKINLNHND
jgi:predicted PurR-regulated permease PerM